MADRLAEFLDFGGKYLYLKDRYIGDLDQEAFQQTAITIFSLWIGIFVILFFAVLASPFGRPSHTQIPGCSRYGLPSDDTNLKNELSPHHSSSPDKIIQVQSLNLYPIKSCAGISVSSAEIIPTGIKYDRQFCFAQLHSPFPLSIDASDREKGQHQWRFITQRDFPLLSQVKTELWLPDTKAKDYDEGGDFVKTGGALVVRFPYEDDGFLGAVKTYAARLRGYRAEKSFIVPFDPTFGQRKKCISETFKIWKDTPLSLNLEAILPSNELAQLKYSLGVRNPFTLFRVQQEREIFRCAPRQEELGWQPVTGFADAYPLNIMNLASVQAVTKMQPPGSAPLGFLRFRANIAITGPLAFVEEEWKKIRIGASSGKGDLYHVVCRCVRCGIPNINPKTGVKDRSEPYKTLCAQRNVDAGSSYGCLGMQMVPVKPNGIIRVGDIVEVLAKGDHVYEKM